MAYKTEQEKFWSGEFGERYIARNKSDDLLASNIALFAEILNRTGKINSVIEFGSNIGMNLKAIKILLPGISCGAVEINHKAVEVLQEDSFFGENIEVSECSILEYEAKKQYDFALIKGVLIHINPDELKSGRVDMPLTGHTPHGTGRAALPHPALCKTDYSAIIKHKY